VKLVEGLPSSNRGCKDGYFFVCGDNWEKLPEEGEDYIRIRRTWGTPSSSVCVLLSLLLFFFFFFFFFFLCVF
jgi:hypothetical protein